VRRLLASGLWVVVAAVAVTLVALLPRLGDLLRRDASGTGHDTGGTGFDLSSPLVPREEIVPSGMARDGLKVLDRPVMLTVAEVDAAAEDRRGKLLVPSDRVIGVVVGGEARAYPLRLLRWHEVVNDRIGGEPVLVSYNPLADSVVVAKRVVDGETLEFGLSGLLVDSIPLLYDRRADLSAASLWHQLAARAVAGPLSGRGLEIVAADLAPWSEWRRRHPNTLVLAPDPGTGRLYRRDPYHSYRGSDLLRFPVDPLPASTGLRLKDHVVAIGVGDETEVFALPHLAVRASSSAGTVLVEVGGDRLRLTFDQELGTALVEPVDSPGARLEVRHAYWFAWHATWPDAALAPAP
jgi:hypothetical protein